MKVSNVTNSNSIVHICTFPNEGRGRFYTCIHVHTSVPTVAHCTLKRLSAGWCELQAIHPTRSTKASVFSGTPHEHNLQQTIISIVYSSCLAPYITCKFLFYCDPGNQKWLCLWRVLRPCSLALDCRQNGYLLQKFRLGNQKEELQVPILVYVTCNIIVCCILCLFNQST